MSLAGVCSPGTFCTLSDASTSSQIDEQVVGGEVLDPVLRPPRVERGLGRSPVEPAVDLGAATGTSALGVGDRREPECDGDAARAVLLVHLVERERDDAALFDPWPLLDDQHVVAGLGENAPQSSRRRRPNRRSARRSRGAPSRRPPPVRPTVDVGVRPRLPDVGVPERPDQAGVLGEQWEREPEHDGAPGRARSGRPHWTTAAMTSTPKRVIDGSTRTRRPMNATVSRRRTSGSSGRSDPSSPSANRATVRGVLRGSDMTARSLPISPRSGEHTIGPIGIRERHCHLLVSDASQLHGLGQGRVGMNDHDRSGPRPRLMASAGVVSAVAGACAGCAGDSLRRQQRRHRLCRRARGRAVRWEHHEHRPSLPQPPHPSTLRAPEAPSTEPPSTEPPATEPPSTGLEEPPPLMPRGLADATTTVPPSSAPAPTGEDPTSPPAH